MEAYFTFPDGGLRYDCAACGQRCCRGKGIAFSAPELLALGRRVSAVVPFLRLRPGHLGGAADAANFTDGCWFLLGDGLCAIETESGREAKPGTCRLFPFNRVYRVGEVLVVDVNTLLCPVQPAGPGDPAGVRHAELLGEIQALSGSPLVGGPAPEPPGLAADWLAVERGVAEAAAAGAVSAPGGEGDAAAWARLYGVEPAEREALEGQVAPLLGLILPSLRFRRLFSARRAPYVEEVARLPRRTRGLLFLGALALRSTGRAPSLRTLSELWEGQGGALDVFMNWDQPVRLSSPQFGADVLPGLGLERALGALLSGAFRGGRTLGALVEAAADTLGEAQRPLAVTLAASQLGTFGL